VTCSSADARREGRGYERYYLEGICSSPPPSKFRANSNIIMTTGSRLAERVGQRFKSSIIYLSIPLNRMLILEYTGFWIWTLFEFGYA
jgi:hypothetical protein